MSKILLVEDNYQVLKVIERLLKREMPEANVLTAVTAGQARSHMAGNKDLSLVILDGSISAPLDGVDLIEELRVGHRYDGPIITIAGTDEDRSIMMRVGATHELEKPGKINFIGILAREILTRDV